MENNIHVLQTDKEPIKGNLLLRHLWKGTSNECISWWRYNDTITIDGVTQYTTLNGSFRDITSSFKTQNIYITSDEEIKIGDWYLDTVANVLFKNDKIFLNGLGYKKIILTTDQDLIKNGVQAIDDEFLEWFVNNPSCERVEVTYGLLEPFKSEDKGYLIHCPDNDPKEELKLEDVFNDEKREGVKKLIHEVKSIPAEEILANRSNAYEFLDFDKQEFERGITITYVGKQETLEEVAENYANQTTENDEFYKLYVAFKEGAKWQQEQLKDVYLDAYVDGSRAQAKLMYSEEDLKEAFKYGRMWDMTSFEDWFEQFKNK